MMPFYPPFGFNKFRRPSPFYPYYNNYYNNLHNSNSNEQKNSKVPYFPNEFQKTNNENFNKQKNSEQDNFSCSNNIDFNNTEEYKEDFFDFFGLKLASDDVLILVLLFFLYKEDVKDTYLYIALLLLLFS